MLFKNGDEFNKFRKVDECMFNYHVNHCYSSSFTSPKDNKITAHWGDSRDLGDMAFKNEELIIKHVSSISGKQFVGYVEPAERKREIVYTYKAFAIGTCIQINNACLLIEKRS